MSPKLALLAVNLAEAHENLPARTFDGAASTAHDAEWHVTEGLRRGSTEIQNVAARF